MAIPLRTTRFFFLLLSLFLSGLLARSRPFSPVDNHLINCGSPADTALGNRLFTGDSSTSESPVLLSTRTIPLRNEAPSPYASPIYNTARVFTRPTNYAFDIRDRGTHLVRLHFYPFASSGFDLGTARFHVLADGYVLSSNLTGQYLRGPNPEIKEYLIWVDSDRLVITFMPSDKSNFAFVNAIEVISAPKDLVLETAQYVNSDGTSKFDGLNKQAFEVVYRVTVGGPKVTPFNDTLWRTWIPDGEFLKSEVGSTRVHFSGRIKYQDGGASHEVAPDNVYNTARVIRSTSSSIPNVNMTWVFPVDGGYKYLVRTHFCDIASPSLNSIYFNVYVNGYLAYDNLDLSYNTLMLASPFYADFVVDVAGSGILNVSIGPSNISMPNAIDGILNAVEVMKFNNSVGSLDGGLSVEMVLKSWPRGTVGGALLPLITIVCFLLVISLVMRRRTSVARSAAGWIRMPVAVSDDDLKHDSKQLSGKW